MNLTKEKHATHTPGPWYTYQSHKDVNRHIACKDGKSIAKEVHHANARLIAAAPEMYKILREVLIDYKSDAKIEGRDLPLTGKIIREVLAKVDGGEG
tara:strand:+ start:1318 stop:1608 length:291 start_codon:yes stop_codon:yes gene_type:complete